MPVVDDCIVVDGRLAVPGQLRPAVLKRFHRGHPGPEVILEVSRYLWWPHMHKDIVIKAEECRICTRYGKNVKYIKILRDKFIKNSDRLDKEQLERSALTASQLKGRIDQSRDNVKIMRKGQSSRKVSPLFKSEKESAKDRDRAKALRTLLEANNRCNATRRDTSANEIKRILGETSTINPELRKELLNSWEYGFIEDKSEEVEPRSPNLLRKDEGRKNVKALANQLKGKVQSESPHTVRTAAGAIYRKSDIAEPKIDTDDLKDKSPKKHQYRRSCHGDEPKSKTKKIESGSRKKNSDSEEMPEIQESRTWKMQRCYSKVVNKR